MEIVEERLNQAEGQLAYWREQAAVAGRQVAMWEGAVEALRGVREALGGGGAGEQGGEGAAWDETFGVDEVEQLKADEG